MNSMTTPGDEARPFDAAKASLDRISLACDYLSEELAERFTPAWDRGRSPILELTDDELGIGDDALILSALTKAEMRRRFARGELVDSHEYLARFPLIRNNRERVVSVVYEEFCLREEKGLQPHAESFCDRYSDWADSLASQLRYHRMLSCIAGTAPRPSYPPPGGLFADRFRLRSILGEGGTARVYLAEQPECGDRPVALKVSAGLGEEPSIQGRLDHAHIVPVFSVIDDESTGLRGLCMPYRPGRPLDLVIRLVDPRKNRPTRARQLLDGLDPLAESVGPTTDDQPGWRGFPRCGTYCDAAAWVIARVARALGHAHSRGILHRDVKPANILLTNRDGPQLLDFNLAHDPHSFSQAHAAMRGGTLPYMAPEQLRAFLDPQGWNSVGPQADIFSLGLVLDELLTGERPPSQPVDETSLPRLINEMLDLRLAPRRSPRNTSAHIPHGLAAIVAKCLDPDPSRRFQSAQGLADDLERFVHRQPLRTAHNPSRVERMSNRFTRWRLGIAAVAAAVAFSVCVPMIYGWFVPEPDEATLVQTARGLLTRMEQARGAGQSRRELENRNRADALLVQVLKRNPASFQALLGRAHIAFLHDGNFAESVSLYNKAFRYMDEAGVPADDRLRPLLSRATAQLALARQTQGLDATTPETLLRSHPYYEGALRDLNTVRALCETNDLVLDQEQVDDPFRLEFFSATGLIGLADVETGGCSQHLAAIGLYVQALSRCQEAQRVIDSMRAVERKKHVPASLIERCTVDLQKRESETRNHCNGATLDYVMGQCNALLAPANP